MTPQQAADDFDRAGRGRDGRRGCAGMSSLDEIVKKIGPSIILPGIAPISLPPAYRQMINRAQEMEVAAVELEQRLERDREDYGITEEEQAKLLRTGWYETALAFISTAPKKTAYTETDEAV